MIIWKINDVVNKIRDTMRFVKSSLGMLDFFKAFAKQLNSESNKIVYLDASTRWNSIYLMLSAVEKYEIVFVAMEVKET